MMLKKILAFGLVLMLALSMLVMLAPDTEASVSTAIHPDSARWKDAGQGQAYISGQNVLTFNRVILLRFDIDAVIGTGKLISKLNLTITHTYNTASGPIDVFSISAFTGGGFSTTTFTNDYINSELPEDGHAFQLKAGSHSGEGMNEEWQTQYDTDGYIYIGLALWNEGTDSKSYGIDLQTDMPDLVVTYDKRTYGIEPYAVGGVAGVMNQYVVGMSGNNVLYYDRLVIMAYDLEAEIGTGANISDIELTLGFSEGYQYIIDVYAIDPFVGSGAFTRTFNDTFINAQCPDDGQVFNVTRGSAYNYRYFNGHGMNDTWQEQYDDTGFIYIGLAGWSFTTADTTVYLNLDELFLNATYTIPPTWAPTITSSSSGNDTVCFMDPYVYEFSANETVTWELVSVTPPAGGNATWLDMEDESLAGVPFPICGPDGIGEYEVSVKAVSDEGTLAAWQNFTLTVTSKRGGENLYEPFGTFEVVEQQPGLYGSGDDVQNATLTWDVNDTDLYYGGFDADALEGYGWELSTVAYVDGELAIILTHNDTERTYGVYGKDDLESLNGTAAIQILDARITIGNSTIYARATNINVTAYYFGLTGVKVNGVPYGLDISLPEYSNVTLEFTTTLDDVAASLGYKVFIYSITYNDGDGFYSWWDGGAANDSAIQYKLTDVHGEYGNTVGMWVTPEGNYTEKLAGATGTLRLTIREPYAPEITSTAMAKAYVGEEYSFTFAAVETDLFILQYPVPSWATWDNATGTFTGTPEVGDLGVYMIVVYPYNTTDGITGDPFYAQFIVRPAAEAGDGIGFFGYVFSSIIALLFCIFLSISKDGFNATVFMALVPMAIAVLISVGAMPLWTIIVGILFYGILIFRNVGPGDSL